MDNLLNVDNKKQPSINQIPLKPLQPKHLTSPKGINIELLKNDRLMGMSIQQIADKHGCSHTNVINRLHGVVYSKEEIEWAKKNLVNIQMNEWLRYGQNITDKKLKAESAINLRRMQASIFNDYRIAAGEPTEIRTDTSLHMELKVIEQRITNMGGKLPSNSQDIDSAK